MKQASLLAVLFVIFATPLAASDYNVRIVGRADGGGAILVDGKWHADYPERFRVRLKTTTDQPAKGLTFRAYFFDQNKLPLKVVKEPNAILVRTKEGEKPIAMPDPLKAGRSEDVLLALVPEAAQWKTVIVIFGRDDDLVYDVYPGSKSLEGFEFAEKVKLKTP